MTESPFDYPASRREDVVDDYHGTPVADPYRWLEDAESSETEAWVKAQNALTRSFLEQTAARETIRQRLQTLLDYAKYSVPLKRGSGDEARYFFLKNEGLQNQPVLYWQETLQGAPRPLIDPNSLSSEGTVALINYAPSRDGRLLAYSLSASGSDWQEIQVLDVDTGEAHEDRIEWVKFTNLAWAPDNSGFYYSRYPEPGSMPDAPPSTHHRLYWHALGTPQSEDELVYARPDAPDLGFDPTVTHDGQYLVLDVWQGTDVRNRVYYRPLAQREGSFIRLLDEGDARYSFIGNVGSLFYFHTDREAPRGRIVAIDVEHPEQEAWREVVAEGEDVIDQVRLVNGQLVVVTLHHASHRIALYTLAGEPAGQVELPTLGSIYALSGRPQDEAFFIHFQSYLYPPTVFRYDFTTSTLSVLYEPDVDFDPGAYETKQVFYSSADGTRVPMFLTHKRGLAQNGENPALLTGYGGFAASMMPYFATSWLLWLEAGGVLAVANLRGGNEYGEAWHQAGMLEKKQNVFDDFIGAAQWLVEEGYTSREKLGIIGGSNGGLLVAAAMLQRPDLFGAVVAQVPVADMLRYHRFTAGRYWIPEYGNAEEEAAHFRFLYAYSPLHNVIEGEFYPPTLITTADTDDRVVPLHAKKLAATLQAANASPDPILLRVETAAGHGLGKPTTKIIEEQSDVLAFLFYELNLEV